MDEARQPTEWQLIERFTNPSAGIGDDCAVVSKNETTDWLITTDTILEGVHFEREWMDLASLGRKALLSCVSDIAAMGGAATFYLVSMALPPSVTLADVEHIRYGMRVVERDTGITLIGGNTARCPHGFSLTLTAIGEIPKGTALVRTGAREGDVLYVTGTFGSAALGVAALRAGCLSPRAQVFVDRYRVPPLRLQVGQWLRTSGCVTSMIDISDGLVADVGHIARASGVGFIINEHKVPVDSHFYDVADFLSLDAIHLKLSGGEDYELAFTVAREKVDTFEVLCADKRGSWLFPFTRIGNMTHHQEGKVIHDSDGKVLSLSVQGFDHFAS